MESWIYELWATLKCVSHELYGNTCVKQIYAVNKQAHMESTLCESCAVLICMSHELYGYTCVWERYAVNKQGTKRQYNTWVMGYIDMYRSQTIWVHMWEREMCSQYIRHTETVEYVSHGLDRCVWVTNYIGTHRCEREMCSQGTWRIETVEYVSHGLDRYIWVTKYIDAHLRERDICSQ